MALFFNFIYRKNPLRREEPKKIYLTLKNVRLMRVDEVTKRIAQRTGLHADMCRSVLNSWNEEAIELLSHGYSVELGNAGYIYLTAASKGTDDMEEATERLIKNIRGHLAFSKDMKAAFNKVERINAAHMVSGINSKDFVDEENG